jgi:hypothetical protein
VQQLSHLTWGDFGQMPSVGAATPVLDEDSILKPQESQCNQRECSGPGNWQSR